MNNLRLLMITVGCKPQGRHTEQHDTFFGIAEKVAGITVMGPLIPHIKAFWPDAGEGIHIDAIREIRHVDNRPIIVLPREDEAHEDDTSVQLFFLNLGAYAIDNPEELHHKVLITAPDASTAIREAKNTSFFKKYEKEKVGASKGIHPHVDDKYGVDVDDTHKVKDILPAAFKEKYKIVIGHPLAKTAPTDLIHVGYIKLEKKN